VKLFPEFLHVSVEGEGVSTRRLGVEKLQSFCFEAGCARGGLCRGDGDRGRG